MRLLSTLPIMGAVLAVILMVAVVPVSAIPAQQTPGPPFGDDAPGVGFSSDGNMSQEQIRQRVGNMSQIASEKRMFGPFGYTDGLVDGRFVNFSYNETSGELSNYSVLTSDGHRQVFDSVSMESFQPDDHKVAGPTFNQWNSTSRMMIHDNPTSMLRTQSDTEGTNTSLLLNDDMEAETVNVSGDGDAVRITSDDIYGMIRVGNGSIEVDNSTDDVYVNVTASEGSTLFRMKPYFAGTGYGEALNDAVADGRVSNEMSVMARNGDVLTVESDYDDDYGMQFQEMTEDRFTVEASSNTSQGKVMMLVFDNGTVDVSQDIEVSLDGNDVSAGDVDDVLNATGDGDDDAVYALVDENGTQYVIGYVPQFSTHTLSIGSTSTDEGGDVCFGILAIAGVGALAVPLTMVRRRR